MPKTIIKTTSVEVSQTYVDEKCVRSEAKILDHGTTEYTDENGDYCNAPVVSEYFGYDMVQPDEMAINKDEQKIVRYALSFLDREADGSSEVAEEMAEDGISHSKLQELLKSLESFPFPSNPYTPE